MNMLWMIIHGRGTKINIEENKMAGGEEGGLMKDNLFSTLSLET